MTYVIVDTDDHLRIRVMAVHAWQRRKTASTDRPEPTTTWPTAYR
jgi:hypothetical protein